VKLLVWTESAQTDVRALGKPTAMRILSALHRFAESGAGDVKALQGEHEELRLRIGDYGCSSSTPPRTPSRFAASCIARKPTADRGAIHPHSHQAVQRSLLRTFPVSRAQGRRERTPTLIRHRSNNGLRNASCTADDGRERTDVYAGAQRHNGAYVTPCAPASTSVHSRVCIKPCDEGANRPVATRHDTPCGRASTPAYNMACIRPCVQHVTGHASGQIRASQ
jgi:hypothetical protein